MDKNGMVIVGAGEAGARAAIELRQRGWSGPITLIGNEQHFPYERPPLSKQHLTAAEAPQPALVASEAALREHGIRFLAGDAAIAIDRGAHAVELASGARVPYERLLLATGANPRPLRTGGDGDGGLLYLRRLEDAARIRERLAPGRRVAIVGGGFIGLETAASAIARGCRVTLIEAAPRILMRGVPPEMAALVERRHQEAGVEFRTGSAIASVDRAGEALAIALADGERIVADTVIAGIGAVPETSLAESSGLAVDNGVRTDGRLATSDPDIFAAGDCCSFPHPLYGGRAIRLEAWRNAQDQGMHAAGSMLGDTAPYAAVPWFWSDQYDQTLQVAGLADAAAATIVRELGAAGRLFFHLAGDGRLVAASGIGTSGGIAREIRLAEMLIERRAHPAPSALADPGRRLKELLRDADARAYAARTETGNGGLRNENG